MGTTPRAGLHFPASTDAPDGPGQIATLALDVDGQLFRALPVANAAARTALGTMPEGSLVRERDTDLIYIADETGAWSLVGSSGGGGSAVAGSASYYASGVGQSIASGGGDIPVAFAQTTGTPSQVTRATSGVGHSFTLGRSGFWIITATVRYASTASAAERTFDLRAGSTVLSKAGGFGAGVPATAPLSRSRYLAAGTVITVVANQYTGAALSLEPSGGDWVNIDFVALA